MSIAIYLGSTIISLLLTMPLAVFTYLRLHEHALYRNNLFSLAFVAIALGVFLLVARLARGRVCAPNLLAGALLLWAVPLIPAQIYLPGGVFSVMWPLAFSTLGLLLLVFAKDPHRPAPGLLIAAALTVLPAVVLLGPQFVMFSYTLTSMAVPIFNALVLALVACLLPQTLLIPLKRHTQAGLFLLAAGFVLYAAAFLSDTPSPTRRHMNCLSYAVNFDTNEASWVSDEVQLDEWTRNFFKDDGPRAKLDEFFGRSDDFAYRKAPAPAAPFAKMVIEKRDDRVVDGHRKLSFFIDSPRDAQEVNLRIDSDVQVYHATVLGKKLDKPNDHWHVELSTMPFAGGEMQLEVEPNKPLKIVVREISYKLPEILNFPPRPDWMMTQTNRRLDRSHDLESNHTYSVCTYTF